MKKKIGKRELILVIVAVVMLIAGGGYELFYVPKAIVSGEFAILNKGLESANLTVSEDVGSNNLNGYQVKINYIGEERVCKAVYFYYYIDMNARKLAEPVQKSVLLDGHTIITTDLLIPKFSGNLPYYGIAAKLYGCDENNKPNDIIVEEYDNLGELQPTEVFDSNTNVLTHEEKRKGMPLIYTSKYESSVDPTKNREYVKIKLVSGNRISSFTAEIYDIVTGKFSPVTLADKDVKDLVDSVNQSREEINGSEAVVYIDQSNTPKVFRLKLTDVNGNTTINQFLIQAINHTGPFCFADKKNITIDQGDYADVLVTCMTTFNTSIDSSTEFANSIPYDTGEAQANNSNVNIKRVTLGGYYSGSFDGTTYLHKIRITGKKVGNSVLTVIEDSIRDTKKQFLSNDFGDYTMSLVNVNVVESIPPKVLIKNVDKLEYTKNEKISFDVLIYPSKSKNINLTSDDFNVYLDGELDNDAVSIETHFGGVSLGEDTSSGHALYSIDIIPLKVGKLKISVKENLFKNYGTNIGNKESNSFGFTILEQPNVEPEKPICVMYKNAINNPSSIKLGDELMFAFECSSDFVFSNTNQNSTSSIKKEDINIYLNGKLDNDAVEFLIMKDTNSYFEFAGVNSTSNAVAFAFLMKQKKAGKIEVSLKKGVVSDKTGSKFNEESNKVEYNVFDEKVVKPVCSVKFNKNSIALNESVDINIECNTKDSKLVKMTNEEIFNSLRFSNTTMLTNISITDVNYKNEKYSISLRGFGTRAGVLRAIIKQNTFKETYGTGNNITVSTALSISSRPIDKTPPQCSFEFNKNKVKFRDTITGYLTCTDASGLKDSQLSSSDIVPSGLIKKVSVESIRKISSNAGLSYTWAITLKGRIVGSSSISLKQGALSDNVGNKNAKTTSSSIKVSLFK